MGSKPLAPVSDAALIDLLRSVPDTHEIVISRAVAGDGLLAAWRAAAEEEHEAYARWAARPGRLTHAAYLAAADQADAAVATLEAAGLSWACAQPLPA